MEKTIIAKAYDGTLVRIKESDFDEFKSRTKKIQKLLKSGKSKEEVLKLLERGEI